MERNDLFKALFSDSYGIKLIIEAESGRIIEANKAASNFYGYTYDEMLAMNINQINVLPEEQIKQEMQNAKSSIKNRFHFKHRLKNGEIRDVEVNSGKINLDGKELLYSDIHDITIQSVHEKELLKTNTKLYESEQHINKLIEILDAIYLMEHVYGRHGNFDILCNDIVNRIVPTCLQFPEKAIVSLQIEDKIYTNVNQDEIKQNSKCLRSSISSFTDQLGELKVSYTDNTPFIEFYEQKLLDVFAKKISRIIESLKTQQIAEQNEDRILENTLKFKSLTDNSFDLVSVLDASGQILFESKATNRILGYKAGERVGKNAFSFVHPEDIQLVMSEFEQMVAVDRSTKVLSFRFKHKNGTWKLLESSAQNFLTNPYIGGIIVNSRDITEQQKAEEALKVSEEKYKMLVQNQGEGIGFSDENEVFKFANAAAEKIFGVEEGGLIGRSLTNFLSEESIKLIKNETKKRKQGISSTYELEIIQPSGKIVNLLTTVTPRFDEQGNYFGALGIFRDNSDRKKMEQDIKESEAKIKAILHAIPDMIFIQNLNGEFIDYYAPKDTMPFVPPKNFLGKKMEEIFPHDFCQKLKPAFVNAIHSNELQFLEYTLPVSNRLHYYEARIQKIEKDKVLNIVRDITNEKFIEQAHLASEEKYRLITENVSDVIWILNVNSKKYTYISPSIYSLRGLTVEEAMTEGFHAGLTKESKRLVIKHLNEIIPKFKENPESFTQKIFRHELQHYNKSGEIVWIESDTRFRYNKQQEIELVGVSRKIDERKRQEQKILHRLRYEESISLCSSALLHQNEDALSKTISYILHGTEASRVYIFENFIDRDNNLSMRQTHEVCAKNVKPEMDNPLLQHLRYKEDGFNRWKEILQENKILSGNVSDFPILEKKILEAQNIKSILVIPIWVNRMWYGFIGFDDVKLERKWNLEDIKLLKTVAEMIGLYLENNQKQATIVKSNKELEILNATKDKFLSIVAHDLKSPFASILGFSELLVKNLAKYEKEKILKFVQAILDSSRSAYKLVENLLEWARSQSGKIEFNPIEFNLKSLMLEAIFIFENAAKAKQIELNYQVDQEIVAYGDKNMINTVLRNLISNAIKFTHRKGAVTITATKSEHEFQVLVSDTGTGMSDETIRKLFKINEKVSVPGTEQEKGTGLGLLLCKEFVEKHQGKIWVESSLGKGSTFAFSLPFTNKNVIV
ncbi:MAG: PAS domain S-box protein [Bacteroidales bacterium]|nr:PAS domain S-box protein [Bacteroidales bacterium]